MDFAQQIACLAKAVVQQQSQPITAKPGYRGSRATGRRGRQMVIDALTGMEPLSVRQISDITGQTRQCVRHYCHAMTSSGVLIETSDERQALYSVAKT